MNTWHIYTAHMSPTLNVSSALQHFKHSNVLEIHSRQFLPGTATYRVTLPSQQSFSIEADIMHGDL